MKKSLVTVLFALLVSAASAAATDLPAALLDPYLRVQDALARDKTDSVKQDAAAMANASAAAGSQAKPIADAARELERAGSLAAARDAFGKVSEAMLAYAKASGSTPPRDVKVAFCPMNSKSWLQKGDKIRNPYYGPDMGECGEFRK